MRCLKRCHLLHSVCHSRTTEPTRRPAQTEEISLLRQVHAVELLVLPTAFICEETPVYARIIHTYFSAWLFWPNWNCQVLRNKVSSVFIESCRLMVTCGGSTKVCHVEMFPELHPEPFTSWVGRIETCAFRWSFSAGVSTSVGGSR